MMKPVVVVEYDPGWPSYSIFWRIVALLRTGVASCLTNLLDFPMVTRTVAPIPAHRPVGPRLRFFPARSALSPPSWPGIPAMRRSRGLFVSQLHDASSRAWPKYYKAVPSAAPLVVKGLTRISRRALLPPTECAREDVQSLTHTREADPIRPPRGYSYTFHSGDADKSGMLRRRRARHNARAGSADSRPRRAPPHSAMRQEHAGCHGQSRRACARHTCAPQDRCPAAARSG